MTEMFVVRRANADLFTEQTNTKLMIPVWSEREAPARYKERNPRPMTCLAARRTRSLVDGVAISLEEILPGAGRTLTPAR